MSISAWKPTLCFRRFRNKHTELSKIYWMHNLGAESLQKLLIGENPENYPVNVIGTSFPVGMFPYKISETSNWINTYLDRARLHLLVICSANLEAYLQDVTYYHLVSLGYNKDLITLDDVGKALGAPILSKDSLPEPLKFAQKLYKINYGVHLTSWIRAYKLRCATVHDGGVVTARTKKDIPDLGLDVDEMLGLTWDELKSLLSSAEQIATITDQALSSYKIKIIEAANVLVGLKEQKQLPTFRNRDHVWKFLYDNYGIYQINKNEKAVILNYLGL